MIKNVCLCVCPSVRYIFLRNHWTEFDETLHALFTLPDDVKNAKKNFDFAKKKFDFTIFSNFCRSFDVGDSSVNFKNSKNLLKY